MISFLLVFLATFSAASSTTVVFKIFLRDACKNFVLISLLEIFSAFFFCNKIPAQWYGSNAFSQKVKSTVKIFELS